MVHTKGLMKLIRPSSGAPHGRVESDGEKESKPKLIHAGQSYYCRDTKFTK